MRNVALAANWIYSYAADWNYNEDWKYSTIANLQY